MHAQSRTVVVADMETQRPLRDVVVHLDNGNEVKLDWTGKFLVYHYNFKSATITHPNYLERVMTNGELDSDTIFLLPLHNTLSEVVVVGKSPGMSFGMQKIAQEAAATGVRPSGHDFLSVFYPSIRKRKKRYKETMKALENY